MKNRLLIAMLLLVLTLGTACAGSEGSGDSGETGQTEEQAAEQAVLTEDALAGTWNLTAIWADMYYTVEDYNAKHGTDLGESLDLNGDGSAVYHYKQNGEPVDAKGSWEIQDQSMVLTLEDGTALTYSYVSEEDEEPFLAFEAKDVNGNTKYVVVFEK